MKFNWVNLLATLLIIGGVALLLARQFHGPPAHHVPTIEEAKADIERQIETKLGRTLSEAEMDMIDVSKSGEQINITLHQPLTGRLMQAIHNAKAATSPSIGSTPNSSDMTSFAASVVHMAPDAPATAPAPNGAP